MGLESAGGVLKFVMRDCVEVCANKCGDAVKNEVMRMAAACGNLEDKRVMFVDYSCFAVAAGAGAGPWRVGAEQPLEGWEMLIGRSSESRCGGVVSCEVKL